MSPTQQYVMLRQVGFSHAEAYNFVNRGVIPRFSTDEKRQIVQYLLMQKRKQQEKN